MNIGATYSWFILIAGISLYIASVIWLSNRKAWYWGTVLPIICLIVSLYNLMVPMILKNPNPNFAPGMYAVFYGVLSVIGLGIFLAIKHYARFENHHK